MDKDTLLQAIFGEIYDHRGHENFGGEMGVGERESEMAKVVDKGHLGQSNHHEQL